LKIAAVLLPILVFAAASALPGQSATASNNQTAPATNTAPATKIAQASKAAKKKKKTEVQLKPFSRLALGGGVGVSGVNLQAATNVNRHLNLRGYGNVLNYTANNISVSDFNLDAKIDFSSAGASLDYYPFPTHGLRLSPGVQFYNGNQITGNAVGTRGSDIKLNNYDYYSETALPLTVNAKLGLNRRQQAFTLTTGWGNTVSRKGGHWSFPFELGAAFTGTPIVNVSLTGYACDTREAAATAKGASVDCYNMATNSEAQSNLTTQVNKWKSDLNPLKVYPIFSFGASYAFLIH
jgi:hypothetical protein